MAEVDVTVVDRPPTKVDIGDMNKYKGFIHKQQLLCKEVKDKRNENSSEKRTDNKESTRTNGKGNAIIQQHTRRIRYDHMHRMGSTRKLRMGVEARVVCRHDLGMLINRTDDTLMACSVSKRVGETNRYILLRIGDVRNNIVEVHLLMEP